MRTCGDRHLGASERFMELQRQGMTVRWAADKMGARQWKGPDEDSAAYK